MFRVFCRLALSYRWAFPVVSQEPIAHSVTLHQSQGGRRGPKFHRILDGLGRRNVNRTFCYDLIRSEFSATLPDRQFDLAITSSYSRCLTTVLYSS